MGNCKLHRNNMDLDSHIVSNTVINSFSFQKSKILLKTSLEYKHYTFMKIPLIFRRNYRSHNNNFSVEVAVTCRVKQPPGWNHPYKAVKRI